jgi:hypothetical protein
MKAQMTPPQDSSDKEDLIHDLRVAGDRAMQRLMSDMSSTPKFHEDPQEVTEEEGMKEEAIRRAMQRLPRGSKTHKSKEKSTN